MLSERVKEEFRFIINQRGLEFTLEVVRTLAGDDFARGGRSRYRTTVKGRPRKEPSEDWLKEISRQTDGDA